MATSITVQTDSALDRITWTFSEDKTTGFFANGEPWVVGPVTITDIFPKPTDTPDIRRISSIGGPEKETVLRTALQPQNAVGTLIWPHGPLQDPNSNTARQGVGTVWHGSMKNPTLDGWGSSQYTGAYAPPNGFDTRIDYSRPDSTAAEVTASVSTYKNNLNVALSVCEGAPNGVTSFTLQAGDMLFSARSYVNSNPAESGRLGSYYSGCLQKIAVLTVLSAAPQAGSFRPSLWGTDKTINWNIDDIDWSVFKSLTLPAGNDNDTVVPYTYADMLKIMPALPWIEWHDNATTSLSIPALNSSRLLDFNKPGYFVTQSNGDYPDGSWFDGEESAARGEVYDMSGAVIREEASYGREAADKFGSVALWLNTGSLTPEKKTIAYRYIQNGLDIFDWLYKYNAGTSTWVRRGGPTGFHPDGGHRQGRKLPVVVAAACLGLKTGAATTALKYAAGQWKAVNGTVSYEGFAEDATVFTVNTGDLTRTINPPSGAWAERPFETYNKSWLGKADWGVNHNYMPQDDSSYQDSTYRSGQHMNSSWLACRLMNLHAVWNHDAGTVLYFERYHGPAAGALLTATTDTASFMYARMMPAYFNLFFVGRKIVTKQVTAVRGAAASGSTLTTYAANRVGTIIAGPVLVGTINWWQIRYKNGPALATQLTGWSPETDINVLGAGFNTTIDGRGGIFEAGKAVSLITSVPDASVYYTTGAIDSSVNTPADYDSSSGVATLNAGSIIGTTSYSLPSGDTVFTTAIVREGYDMSDVTSATYRIDSSGVPVQPSQSRGVPSSTQLEPALIFPPTATLTKNDVTWTFSESKQVGQYANGDWWVVGPVTITSVTPDTIRTTGSERHGMMVNPEGGDYEGSGVTPWHGFDSRIQWHEYKPTLNVTLPYTAAVNSSLVKSVSHVPNVPDGRSTGHPLYIKDYQILTVVAAAPAPFSFRPPYRGEGSRVSTWTKSDLKYDKLASLPKAQVLTYLPDKANLEDIFSNVWFEYSGAWLGRYTHPFYMAPSGYGRDIANNTGDAALLLNLDYTSAEKERLLIGFVQYGIDNAGIIAQGSGWMADGGHNIGRLSPLIIAAFVLDDTTLKNYTKGSAQKFQEYQQTFFVAQEDIDRDGLVGSAGNDDFPVLYAPRDLGMPEWGIRHGSGFPTWDNNFWQASYRDINGGAFTAPAMAAKVMGARSYIDYEPFFKYAERHVDFERSSSYGGEVGINGTTGFHSQFHGAFNTAPLGYTAGSIDVAWSAATGTVTEYRIYTKLAADSTFTLAQTVASTVRSTIITGLAFSTNYTVKVVAYNSSTQVETSVLSPYNRYTPPQYSPYRGAGFVSTWTKLRTNGSFDVTWPAASTTPFDYAVYVKFSGQADSSYVLYERLASDVLTTTIKDRVFNANYIVAVDARYAVTPATDPPTYTPTRVLTTSVLSAVPLTDGNTIPIEIPTRPAAYPAPTGYKGYFRRDYGMPWIDGPKTTTSQLLFTGVLPNTQYQIKVTPYYENTDDVNGVAQTISEGPDSNMVLCYATATTTGSTTTSITHYGVTLTFNQAITVGQTIIGEPLIVAAPGLQLTSITNPSLAPVYDTPSGTGNTYTVWPTMPDGGAELNPVLGDAQGFLILGNNNPSENRHYYLAEKNVKTILPVSDIVAGDTLCVAVLKNRSVGSQDYGKNAIQRIVSFTFVSSIPAIPSFISNRYGSRSSPATLTYNESNVRWNALRTLSTGTFTASAIPTQAALEDLGRIPKLPFFDLGAKPGASWESSFYRPQENCAAGSLAEVQGAAGLNSGQFWGPKWGEMLLWLNCNFTQDVKRKCFYAMIQRGLDISSIIGQGLRFKGSGNHQTGTAGPLALAAAALNDSVIYNRLGLQPENASLSIKPNDNNFVEGPGTTRFITQADVGKIVQAGNAQFIQADVGRPAWGIDILNSPLNISSDIEDYRDIYIGATTGQLIAMEAMGLADAFNHPPAFAYARWSFFPVSRGVSETSIWAQNEFHKDFFLAHINSPVHVQMATSITQHGITWTFSDEHEIGQFVNGDYYVVAPPEGIIVNSVTPVADMGRHGAMINPGLDSHAWDARISGYNSELNIQFPYLLKPGQSLVKVVSILDGEWVNGTYNTQWQGNTSDRYKLKTAAVLTCLDIRPPNDSFRPPYIGNKKPIFRYGSVNRNWFPNLLPPSLLPTNEVAHLERGLERPWIITPFAHSARDAHPVENQPGYHREVGSFLSRASLILCTQASTPKLEIGFIQMGLDYYGMSSQPTGTGDSSFWKWPVIFTGLLLGKAEIYHLFSNGVYRGIPRDGEKFYYLKDGSSSNTSMIIEENRAKPFKKTWTGSRVGFRKGLGNEEHEHLHPSEWEVVASGGGDKQESYRWCCDSHPSTGQIFAAMIISRNADRPSIQAGQGSSRFADTPIKCFYKAGESFDGGNTEEFSAFDYTFRFMMEPFAVQFLPQLLQHYPNFGISSPSNSYSQQMWIQLGVGLMSKTGEYTIAAANTGLQTISTGSYRPGDAQTAWPLWTAVQRGESTDPGYVTTPPGNWLTPTRAIMSAGDLIGVKAACSERCGTLSVEFSLNNGALLTVSNPTIQTDQWGTTEAYWFKLPAGLGNGLHEIRARIKPSSSGNERLLQSAANTSLSSYSDQTTHSLLIAVDNRNYYAQVAVGGTASESAGVGQGTTPNAALPKYASIVAAHNALRYAMGNTTSSTAGATIYLGAGDWGVTTGYTPDDAYWLTIKGAPGVARANIRISVPHNNSGGEDEPNLFNGYLKVQGVTLIQTTQYALFYKAYSQSKLIWLDDFVYQGRGTTEGGGGVIANSSNTHPVTRGQVREVKGCHAQGMASGFVRNVDYYRNTGELFTGAIFVVNSVVTECRGLGLNSGGNLNDTEHADVYQNMGGMSNIILCNIKASSVRINTGPFGPDIGVAAMQQVEGAASPQFVQRSRDCLFQNISLSGFEGVVSFMGGDPIGVLIRHCSFSNWFDVDSRTTDNGLSPTTGSGLAGTYKGCEIVNSIFYDMFYEVQSQLLVSKLKTVGAYRGNHLIAGSLTEQTYQTGSNRSLADSTDTLGALTYNSGTLVPTNTTALSGRVAPAGTLTDVLGNIRIQNNTTAGAFSTLLESGAAGASVLPPGLTLNTSSGLISGTPTTAGTYSLTVSATNSAGTGTKALTIIISPAAEPLPNITSASTATGQAGVAFFYQIAATGNPTLFGVGAVA